MKTLTFGKEDLNGTWKLELYPIDGGAFAKWAFQEYKHSPLGWIEIGNETRFFSKDVAKNTIYRMGYSPID